MSKGETKYFIEEELQLETSCGCSSQAKIDDVLDKVSKKIDDEWNNFFISLHTDTENKTHYLN